MYLDIVKSILSDHDTFVCIGIKVMDLEKIMGKVIEEDTGVNIEDRMTLDYDEENYKMRMVFKEDDIDEVEVENLGDYNIHEWYLSFDNCIASIFGVSYGTIFAYTSEDEVKSSNEDDDNYMVTLYIPMDCYITLQNHIGGTF